MVDNEMPTTQPSTVIRSPEELRQRLSGMGWWVSIPLSTFPAHWLYEGEQRLDSSYYASEALAALRLVRDCGFEVKRLGQITTAPFYPGRFKRVYAKTEVDGIPFLTASAMLHFRPTSDMFLATRSDWLADCRVSPDWILITRSGTVGRCVIAGRRLSRFAISDDAIRLQTRDVPTGYLYAFLSSWIGQALLSKDQYGSTIKHLEPHHVAGVPVPLLPEVEQLSIHNAISQAYTLRDEANDLLDEADNLLHRELGLPQFDESLVPYFPPPQTPQTNRLPMPHPKAFIIQASELNERLDGSYHVPTARTAVTLLRKGKYPAVWLSSILESLFIPSRFKRVYVPKEYGVQFLQGSHLPEMKPYDLKYISRGANAKHIEECLVAPGYVLVTRSGTVGRVALVSTFREGWTASEHLLRIVTDQDKGHPGYLTAFLMTPYGQYQLAAKIYGGVVDELTTNDTGAILIPAAPMDIQVAIGQHVVTAFEKKDEATAIEEATIRQLENKLVKTTQ